EDQSQLPGSEEVFVFAAWSGVLQKLVVATGHDATPPVKLPSNLRGLQVISYDQCLFVTRLIPARSDNDPVGESLCRLDYRTNALHEVLSSSPSMRIKVSPKGRKALFVYLAEGESRERSDRSERWEIKDIQSGKTFCERHFDPGTFISADAVWSPEGQYIAARNQKRDGHLILSTDTLDTVAAIAGTKRAERPAFHPLSTHICLCRADNTAILAMDRLLARP
ncbi:MAG: hypothetical protein WBA92_17260, partial [Pseudorhodobacter sp.]